MLFRSPGDAVELADVLATSMAMPDAERSAMGARARRYVLQAFSLDELKRQTLGIYDERLGTDLAARFQVAIGDRIS